MRLSLGLDIPQRAVGAQGSRWALDATAEAILAAINDPSAFGETLGPELVTNGDFSNGTTGWFSGTTFPSTASVVDGELQVTATAAYGRQIFEFPTVAGRTYDLRGLARRVSGAGSVYLSINLGSGESDGLNTGTTGSSTPVELSKRFTATGSVARVICSAVTAGAVGGFDNVSVREVIAGYRLPGTAGVRLNAAARSSVAMQQRQDGGWEYAAHNLLPNSEAPQSWTSFSNAVATPGFPDPFGGTRAVRIEAPTTAVSNIRQVVSGVGRRDGNTFVIWAKKGSGAQEANSFVLRDHTAAQDREMVKINYDTGALTVFAGSGATATDAGNGWWKITLNGTAASNGNTLSVYAVFSGAPHTAGQHAYIYGPSLCFAPAADAYVPTFGAAVYAPAVDWLAGIGRYGLRSEPAATNLLLWSSDLTASGWLSSGSATVGAAVAAPDGTLTAREFTTTGSSSEYLYRSFAGAVSGATYTVSAFLKAGSKSVIPLYFASGGFAAAVWVVANLSNGTIGAVQTVGGATSASASITQIGDGWYRVSVSGALGAHTTVYWVLGAPTVEPAGTVRVWAPQLETGPVATSPILTQGATATRAADTNVIPLSRSGPASVATEFIVPQFTTIQGQFSLNDGTLNNRIDARNSQAIASTGGVVQAVLPFTEPPAGQLNRFAYGWAEDSFAVSVNGSTPGGAQVDTAGTVPATTQLQLGQIDGGTSNPLRGHLTRIRYAPRRLPNETLKKLSGDDPYSWDIDLDGDSLLAAVNDPTAYANGGYLLPGTAGARLNANVRSSVAMQVRKDELLGPERLVNGDFSQGGANWSVGGTDATHIVTFADGRVRYQSDTTSPVLIVTQPGVLVIGRRYRITVTVSNWVSGRLKTDNFGAPPLEIATGNGTFTVEGVAITNAFAFLRNSTNVDMQVDSISVREILVPAGGYEYAAHNLVINSDTAAFTGLNGATDEGLVDVPLPTGVPTTTRVRQVRMPGQTTVVRFGSAVAGTPLARYFGGVWMRVPAGPASFSLDVNDNTGQGVTVSVGAEWKFVSASSTGTPNTLQFIDIRSDNTSETVVQFCAPRVHLGLLPLPYVPTTSAAVYGPAIDWLPAENRHALRTEPAATNLLLSSTDFRSNAQGNSITAWTVTHMTVTPAATPAPDGSLTGNLVVQGESANAPSLLQGPVADTNAWLCSSVFVKRGNSDIFFHQLFGAGVGRLRVWFNLATGTVAGSQNVAPASSLAASIVDVGGGWFRCSVSGLLNEGPVNANTFSCIMDAAYSLSRVTGAQFYLWGAQLEAGALATSPILTYDAAVTRAADVPVIPETGWASSAYTLNAEAVPRLLSGSPVVVGTALSSSNSLWLSNSTTPAHFNGTLSFSGGVVATLDQRFRAAVSGSETGRAIVTNGAAAVTSPTAMSVPTVLRLGAAGNGVQPFNAHITRVRYLSRRLYDATLQELTSA